MMLQYACCLLLWPRFSPLSHTPSLSSSSIFLYLSFSCTPWCMCLSVLLPARSLFSLLPGLSLHRRSTAHLRRPSVSIFAFVPVICVFSSWPSKGVCAAGKGHVPTRTMIVLVYLDVQYIPMYVYTCGKRRCYCTSRILIPNPLFLLFRPPSPGQAISGNSFIRRRGLSYYTGGSTGCSACRPNCPSGEQRLGKLI